MMALSAPPSPIIPIQDAKTVSPAKRQHPLSSPLAPSTSDSNDNNNLEDNLAQILATMAAGFSSLLQDITCLQLQVTVLTTINQAQAREIQFLATIIQ